MNNCPHCEKWRSGDIGQLEPYKMGFRKCGQCDRMYKIKKENWSLVARMPFSPLEDAYRQGFTFASGRLDKWREQKRDENFD